MDTVLNKVATAQALTIKEIKTAADAMHNTFQPKAEKNSTVFSKKAPCEHTRGCGLRRMALGKSGTQPIGQTPKQA